MYFSMRKIFYWKLNISIFRIKVVNFQTQENAIAFLQIIIKVINQNFHRNVIPFPRPTNYGSIYRVQEFRKSK